MDQHRRDRRIDAAGEPADDVARADFLANRGDGGLDEVRRRPVAARAADAEDKILDQLRPKRRVMHLGMKLHGPDAALLVGDAGQRVGRDGGAMEARGQFQRLVAVAHPDLDRRRQAGKQTASRGLRWSLRHGRIRAWAPDRTLPPR